MTSILEKKKFTYEDYLKTPDDQRCELIEGELIIMTPAPVPYHQWLSKNLGFELNEFIKMNNLGKIFLAPCDVHLDEENVLEPDILFVSNEKTGIIGEKNIQGPPDLVVEVLSESNAYNDLVKKKKIYARFGVKEYWIVDPFEKNVDIYSFKDSVFVLERSFSENEVLESPLLIGLNIKLSDVFAF